MNLDKLEHLANAATSGKWRVVEYEDEHGDVGVYVQFGDEFGNDSTMLSEHNAAFIAAAQPQTVLSLIAELRKQSPDEGATNNGRQGGV